MIKRRLMIQILSLTALKAKLLQRLMKQDISTSTVDDKQFISLSVTSSVVNDIVQVNSTVIIFFLTTITMIQLNVSYFSRTVVCLSVC